jgi:tight adherence protein B
LKSDRKLKFHENQLISFLTAVRQELVSGITVNQAIANVVQDQPRELFVNSRHAGIDGSDQVTSLALDANQLDNASLQQLAKILSINRTSGASITSALDIMIKAALTRQEQRQQIAAELSGVKATITVLALLPVVGTLMGLIMGVNVPYWLLTNPTGWLCLIFALLLETLGLLWVRHLIRGVS